jgi:predicted transcriptional regulator
MSPLKRTTILAAPDLLDRLDRHARATRSTKTALIAAALETYLAAHEEPTRLAFLGVGRSTHGRLSLDSRRITAREAGSRRRADTGT